jgi:hypothetical protein
LTISAGAGGSSMPSGAVTAKQGIALALNAVHATGYHFTEWTVESGTGVKFGDPVAAITTVTLESGNAAIKANFAINDYTLTVTHTGSGSTSPSGSVEVTHDVEVTLNASPGSGQVFVGWSVSSGTGVSIENPSTAETGVTLTEGDATVNAEFEEYHGYQDLAEELSSCTDTVVDGTDVHVAWVSGGILKYRLSADGGMTWGDTLTVDDSGNVGAWCSMAFASDGIMWKVHIAYYDAANADLKHVSFLEGATTFSPTTLDGAGDVGRYCQLAAAPAYYDGVLKPGGICVAYYDATNGDLKIAKSASGSSWFLETVETTGDVGSYCSITHGTSSESEWFLAYIDATNQDVKLARASSVNLAGSTEWTLATLASDATINQCTAIGLDPATGNGVLAYRTDTAATLPVGNLILHTTSDRFATLSETGTTPDSTAGAGVSARLRFRQYGVASYCLSYLVDREDLGSDYARCLVSTDGGASWAVRSISGQLSGSTRAVSAWIQGQVLWFTFMTANSEFPPDFFLRQAKSLDGGATW